MAKQKYYVVWKGRSSGVFNSWLACSTQVNGYAGAEYKSFESLAEAQNAFRKPYTDFVSRPAVLPDSKLKPTESKAKAALKSPAAVLQPSICVDAACAGVPGPVEWRGVLTETNEQIFRAGPYLQGTNNIGEFLAIVHGLAWLQEKQLTWPLYSDSKNAMLWVKVKKCRTKLERIARNEPLFELVARAEAWLEEHQYANKILKWKTETWGENPADFGRK